MEAFRSLLKVNSGLVVVALLCCHIDDEGCEQIAAGIIENSTLSELDLRKNLITGVGMNYILDALIGNYSVMKIQSEENPFSTDPESQELISQLTDYLERNNYYLHNILMRDMATLVTDSCLL
jgi:hypothetical protein